MDKMDIEREDFKSEKSKILNLSGQQSIFLN